MPGFPNGATFSHFWSSGPLDALLDTPYARSNVGGMTRNFGENRATGGAVNPAARLPSSRVARSFCLTFPLPCPKLPTLGKQTCPPTPPPPPNDPSP